MTTVALAISDEHTYRTQAQVHSPPDGPVVLLVADTR